MENQVSRPDTLGTRLEAARRMVPVKSSLLGAIGYCPLPEAARKQFTKPHGFVLVRFKAKRSILAYLVPSQTYASMCKAKSKGRAYNKLLRGQPAVVLEA
jgi:hypothetical protein